MSERACVNGMNKTNDIADFIMQVIGEGGQHHWQSVVWVDEACQTVYHTIFVCIPAHQHFLDGALLDMAVSISVIGCGSITLIEKLHLRLDAGVLAA